MDYRRMPIEEESPEEKPGGYSSIRYNLCESSVNDQKLGEVLPADIDLRTLNLEYGAHLGSAGLRQAIAQLYPANERPNPDHIVVTPGAAAALFMIHTALLRARSDDHAVIMSSNYGTNIETPSVAIGAKVDFVRVNFENGFKCTWSDFASKIRRTTKLLSVTSPHNPSGVSQGNLLSDLVQNLIVDNKDGKYSNDFFILHDETYKFFVTQQLVCDQPASAAAAAAPGRTNYADCDRVIRVASMSKAFGLPGIRIGFLICPSTALRHKLLAAKEQIFICGSVLDEEVARIFLTRQLPAFTKMTRERVERNYRCLQEFMRANSDLLEWVDNGGASVVSFLRFPGFAGHGRATDPFDTATFYNILFDKYKTFVGRGGWFSMPDYTFRCGFGYQRNVEDLRGGLAAIREAALEAKALRRQEIEAAGGQEAWEAKMAAEAAARRQTAKEQRQAQQPPKSKAAAGAAAAGAGAAAPAAAASGEETAVNKKSTRRGGKGRGREGAASTADASAAKAAAPADVECFHLFVRLAESATAADVSAALEGFGGTSAVKVEHKRRRSNDRGNDGAVASFAFVRVAAVDEADIARRVDQIVNAQGIKIAGAVAAFKPARDKPAFQKKEKK